MRAEPSCGMQMLSQLGHILSKMKYHLLLFKLLVVRPTILTFLLSSSQTVVVFFLFKSSCTIMWYTYEKKSMCKFADNILWAFANFSRFLMSTKHKSTLFVQTNKKKHNPQLFAGLQILHQHPQPDLSDKATHGIAPRLHDQNLQFGTSSCVSTRHSHIHINGLFVLRVLATAHRQECLRGEQRRLAGAPPLLSQQTRNTARDLILVPNRSPSSKGWLVKRRDLRTTADYRSQSNRSHCKATWSYTTTLKYPDATVSLTQQHEHVELLWKKTLSTNTITICFCYAAGLSVPASPTIAADASWAVYISQNCNFSPATSYGH